MSFDLEFVIELLSKVWYGGVVYQIVVDIDWICFCEIVEMWRLYFMFGILGCSLVVIFGVIGEKFVFFKFLYLLEVEVWVEQIVGYLQGLLGKVIGKVEGEIVDFEMLLMDLGIDFIMVLEIKK